MWENIYILNFSHNRKKKELFSIRDKLSYYKDFYKKLLTIEIRKTQILPNKFLCLELQILELSKY